MIGFNGGLIGKTNLTSQGPVGVWTAPEQLEAVRNNGWPIVYDPDALAYFTRVEGASGDNQRLEFAVKAVINTFVLGCKSDGIWTAIKASCILAGARTLNGALQPLVGTAPTNVSGLFVSGDYNRKTGLIGNGTTKYLDSNRNNNTDPQNDNHNAVYVSTAATATSAYMGADDPTNSTGTNNFGRSTAIFLRNRAATNAEIGTVTATGLIGTSRAASASFTTRVSGSSATQTITSQTPFNGNLKVFATGTGTLHANARLAFYSIGESLTLATLDTRVTALINALATAIP